MPWYARNRVSSSDKGKFRSYSQLGPAKTSGGNYQGWTYSFVAHQTGSGVKRTRYAVTISDPKGKRAEYLRDFSSIQQATAAAHRWIDDQQVPELPDARPATLGSIPTLPELTPVQEK